jgi:hypothetical protein
MDNNMDISPEDEKVVELLSKLKSSNGAYPSDMLASRRQIYLKQVANVGLGLGIGEGLKNAAKGNGAGATATVTSKILETALIAAIAVEASTAAYLYRDRIADVVKTYASKANVQEVAPPTNQPVLTNPEIVKIIETPSATSTSSTPTVTVSSGTPSPDLAGNTGPGATATAITINNPGGNNGNQYGLTPKPVRTKENNSNNNSGSDGTGGNAGGGNGTGHGNGNK